MRFPSLNYHNPLLKVLRFSKDINGRLAKFERQSASMQLARSKYLLTLATARGPPNSSIRKEQIDELLEDDMFDLDHDLFPKGSKAWLLLFQSLDEGKLLLLAWRRARLATPAITSHLRDVARPAAAQSRRKQAATKGPWIGYNSKRTLAEVLDVILDANQVQFSRTSYQPSDPEAKKYSMRILECTRQGCQAPFGIETEYKRTSTHWCKVSSVEHSNKIFTRS
jgi:hypothetical protein